MLRRYPRAYFALGLIVLALFDATESTRWWESPIRGTSAWITGSAVGAGLGTASAIPWIWIIWRNGTRNRFAPLLWITGVLLLIALLSVNRKGDTQPAITDAYRVGSLAYVMTGLIGTCVVMGILLMRHHGERRR